MMDNLFTYDIFPLISNLIVSRHYFPIEFIYTLINDSVPKKSNYCKSINEVYVS